MVPPPRTSTIVFASSHFSLTSISPLLQLTTLPSAPTAPRAQPPKGEGMRVFAKVLQLTAASVAVFYAIHAFAGKQPATMSKEWQEASNEYALVHITPVSPFRPQLGEVSAPAELDDANLSDYRKRRSTPSTASAKRVTKARASSRAPLPRSHRCTSCPTGNELISTPDGRRHPSHDLYVDLITSYSFHSHVRHVFVSEDGPPPVRAAVDCSILSFLASIGKCVYPVLCYNQCISFVAIEQELWCDIGYKIRVCVSVYVSLPIWRGLRSDSEPT